MIGSISAHFTEFGKTKQPHSESRLRYVPYVEARLDTREVLRDNVFALMRHHYGKENLSRFQKDTGIGIASVSRIKGAKTSVGLEILEQIGRKFGLFSWQLLVPGLDPANPPVLARAGLSEEQWYRVINAAETIAHYGPALRSSGPQR